MRSFRNAALALASVLTLHASGQTMTSALPPVFGFIDISTTGTPIAGVGSETEHNIVTTIGNPLFPAGNVRVSPNGVAISGLIAGHIAGGNSQIATFSLPEGVPQGGLGYLFPFWDDLSAPAAGANTTIWWQETNAALIIMWKDLEHDQVPGGGTITFEVQVFLLPPAPPTCENQIQIQYLYQDTSFGNPAFDFGQSASVGYGAGFLGLDLHNSNWGFNVMSAPSGLTLSVFDRNYALTASSPQGPGSLLIEFDQSPCTTVIHDTYLFAVTLNEGAFPGGWLLGLDIPVIELAGQMSSLGTFTIGPFSGLPPITFYCVALGFINGVLFGHSNPLRYSIP
jgi:hypothetical protein